LALIASAGAERAHELPLSLLAAAGKLASWGRIGWWRRFLSLLIYRDRGPGWKRKP